MPAPVPAPQPPEPPAAVAGGPMPAQMRAMLQRMRAEVEKNCDYVGPEFAEEARKIHRGESDKRGIYGETSPEQAEALAEEGIEFRGFPGFLAPTGSCGYSCHLRVHTGRGRPVPDETAAAPHPMAGASAGQSRLVMCAFKERRGWRGQAPP